MNGYDPMLITISGHRIAKCDRPHPAFTGRRLISSKHGFLPDARPPVAKVPAT